MALGLFWLAYGEKYFKFNAVALISLTVGMTLYSLLGNSIPVHFSAYFIIGIFIGLFAVTVKEVVMTVVGIIIGFFSGNIVFNFTIRLHSYDPDITYWATILFFIVLGICLTSLIDQLVFMIATSIIGAYIFT